jgi:hypothetical protein
VIAIERITHFDRRARAYVRIWKDDTGFHEVGGQLKEIASSDIPRLRGFYGDALVGESYAGNRLVGRNMYFFDSRAGRFYKRSVSAERYAWITGCRLGSRLIEYLPIVNGGNENLTMRVWETQDAHLTRPATIVTPFSEVPHVVGDTLLDKWGQLHRLVGKRILRLPDGVIRYRLANSVYGSKKSGSTKLWSAVPWPKARFLLPLRSTVRQCGGSSVAVYVIALLDSFDKCSILCMNLLPSVGNMRSRPVLDVGSMGYPIRNAFK